MRFQKNTKIVRRQLLHLFLKQYFQNNSFILIYPQIFTSGIFKQLKNLNCGCFSFTVSYSFFLFMLKLNPILSLFRGNFKGVLISNEKLVAFLKEPFSLTVGGFIKFYNFFSSVDLFNFLYFQARGWKHFFEQMYIYSICFWVFILCKK